MAKHRKMMKNKCPEQTLQIKIQYCIQLRSSLATVVWNMSHILLSLFSCNCKAEHADVCCDVWVSSVSNDGKEQNSNCVEEVREVCIIDPALLVTQPETKESIRDILCGLLNDMSLKELVRLNIRQGHKMLIRLDKSSYEVQMTKLTLYSLENCQ